MKGARSVLIRLDGSLSNIRTSSSLKSPNTCLTAARNSG